MRTDNDVVVHKQGDQIGRLFVRWVIVYFGPF
jgi:hypothetical protein